jgi:hypothetical protein
VKVESLDVARRKSRKASSNESCMPGQCVTAMCMSEISMTFEWG